MIQAEDKLAEIEQQLSDNRLYDDEHKDQLKQLLQQQQQLLQQKEIDEELWFVELEQLEQAQAELKQ